MTQKAIGIPAVVEHESATTICGAPARQWQTPESRRRARNGWHARKNDVPDGRQSRCCGTWNASLPGARRAHRTDPH